MFKKHIIILLSDAVAMIYLIVKKLFAILVRKDGRHTLRILIYHSVSGDSFRKDVGENNVSAVMFREQMESLKVAPRRIVGLPEGVKGLSEGSLNSDSIAVTFDDGMRDSYDEALRVLEDFRIPATFFIVCKYADSGKVDFMDWSKVHSLKERRFNIGSHSYSHKRLGYLGDKELEGEAALSKAFFKEKGISVEYFAYPYGFYGDYSPKTGEALRRAGFKAAFSSVMGENRAGDDMFELKRTRVSWRDNRFRFRMKVEGAYDWVDTWKRLYRLASVSKKEGSHRVASSNSLASVSSRAL